MACKINSIEQRYRETNPTLADKLTGIAMDAWQSIKDSGVFQKEGLSYVFNAPDTKKRIEQDKVVDTINATQPIPFVKEKEGKVSVNALLLHTNLSSDDKIENVNFQSPEQYRNILSREMLVEEDYKRIFTNKKGDIYTVQPTSISRPLLLSSLEQETGRSTMQDIWARVVGGTQSESDEMGFVALLSDRLFNRKDEFTSKLFNSKPGGTLGRIYITNDNTFFSADNSGIYLNPKVVFNRMDKYQTFEDFKNALELILTEEVIHYTANNLIPTSWFYDVYNQMSNTKREKIKEIYEFKQTGKDLEHAIANEYIRMALQLEHFNTITEQETVFIIKKIVKKVLNYIKKLFPKEKTAEVVIRRFNTFLKEGNVIPYTDEQLYKDMEASIVSKGEELLRKTKQLYARVDSRFSPIQISETLQNEYGKDISQQDLQSNPEIEFHEAYKNNDGISVGVYTKVGETSPRFNSLGKSIDEAVSRLMKDAENNNIKDDYAIAPIENDSIPDQPRLAHNIEQMLDELATRFQVNWGYDYEMAQRGAIRDGKVLINPNHATFDTPFHEYLHPFINLIKQQGSPFYQLLSNSVMSVTDITGKNILFETKKNNPDLVGDELIEEAIVEAAGLAAIGRLVETPVNKTFLDYLRMFIDNIGKLLGFNFEQHVNLNTPFRTVVNMMLDSNFVYDMRPYANNANQKLTTDQIDAVLNGLNNDLVTETKYVTNEHGVDEEKRKYKNTRTGDIYNGVHEDVVQPYYDKIFPDPIEPTPGMIFQKEAGTILHNIFEQVLYTNFVDAATHQLKEPILEYFRNPDEAAFNKFQAYLEDQLGSINHEDIYSEEDPDLLVIEKENAPYYYEHINAYLVPVISRALKDHGTGVKFFAEQRLLDTEKGRAGTTDLLIIGSEKFDIYDWKTINPTKYNTLNGERTELEMLASFKEAAYKIQMREYIRMVKQLTGLELNKAIAVPIGVETFKNPNGHYLLGGVAFGDPRMKKITVGPSGEERRYLLPVMIKGETPENKTINEFINKLEGYIKVYSNMLQSDKDQRKIARELQIDSLRKIIQDLQIDRNHQNILNRIDVLLKQAEEQIAFDDDSINIEKLTDIKYELDLYKDVQKYFNITGKPKLTYDLAQKQQLVIFMIDKIIDRTNNYTQNAAIKEGVPNILENEMAYSGMKRWFTEMSAITKVKTVAFFDKLKRKYQTKANQEKLKYYEKLGKAMETLNGEDIKKFFRKSADGKMQPFLISKYAMKERLQEATDGADYFSMFDLDQEAYNKGLENYKNMLRDSLHFKERIESDPTLTQKEIDDKNLQIDEYNDRQESKYETKVAAWEERYSTPFEISGNMVATGVHWAYYKLNPEFEEHWQTEEFKELAKNPKRLELYNVIQEINDEAFKLGLITYRNKFTHFPSILANSQEKILAGETGVFSMQRFLDDLKASDQDEETITGGKLEVNPITGKVDRTIPKLYRNKLGIKKEDGTYDYSKQSFNIGKVFGQYVNHIKEYEARQEMELQASLLMDLESRKSNVLAVKNKAVYQEDAQGNLTKEITEGINKNTAILETAINRSVYGVTPFSDMKSTVKVFGKEINLVRSLRKLMAWRSMTSLGLNTTSAVVTGLGGGFNMFLEANKNGIYNKTDITKAMATLTQTTFRESKAMRVLKMLQSIDPIMDDLNEHRINQLSLTKFDQIVTSDNLFVMMRNVDKATQFVSGMAVMNNYMIKDGKLVTIADYVKSLNNFDSEFKRLAQAKEWNNLQKLEEKVKSDIEDLKNSESIVAKELAGEDSGITEEMQRELRPVLQKYSKQILGNMSRDDVAQYKDTILGQLAGQFRGWMPRLAMQRFGGAEIDNVTGKLSWGKYLTLTELLNKDLVKTIQSMFGQLNESSYDRILMKYNDLLQTHIDNGGTKDDFIPLSEFKELYINNLRSSLKEILMMSTMSVMIYALGAAWDDDDKLNAAQRYTLLLLNRANNELTFYINPKSATDLLKSPIPLISTLTDIQSFGSHFSKETFNQAQQLVTGDEEEDLKRAKPVKYLFKLFPITKEMMNWGALLDDDFRKEFNVNLNYR